MPKGYVTGHVTVHDPDASQAFAATLSEILPEFGGRLTARGGAREEVEGDLTGHRHAIIEFPDFDQARAFYNSPADPENMKIRQANSTGHIIVVEGMSE